MSEQGVAFEDAFLAAEAAEEEFNPAEWDMDVASATIQSTLLGLQTDQREGGRKGHVFQANAISREKILFCEEHDVS